MTYYIVGLITLTLFGLINGQGLVLPKGRYDDTLRGLCKTNEAFARVPWDCQAYIQCKTSPGSTEIFLFRCPASLEFDMKHKTCIWATRKCPDLKDVVDQFCLNHPTARLPNPDNCAQYYDCAQADGQFPGKSKYLRECPHPQLFDLVNFECLDYKYVQCDRRQQPVSPCDYLAYKCTGPNCKPCTEGIPGCRGQPDGANPYPGRILSKYYVSCSNNAATSVETCVVGLFDPVQKICTETLGQAAIEAYCAVNPTGKIANPRNCAMFYDCSRRTDRRNFRKFEDECPYPMYFSESRDNCMDFRDVVCGRRSQPVSKCEYQRHSCKGPDCPVCEALFPSCVGLPDGRHSYPGRENTAYFIECYQGRTVDMSSRCRSGAIFDPRSRTCSGGGGTGPITPPIRPPIGPGPVIPGGDCVSNPNALLPDPANCARFLNCSMVNPNGGGLASIRGECPYPQLFDMRINTCANFIEVNCGTRYEPKSPCEYDNTKNLCYGPMCDMPCEERSPSCVDKPDGNNTFPARELTSFYITCLLNRTLSVGICRYGVYDPTIRACTTELDKLSVRNFCRSYPSTIFPHVANCAKYYNCSETFESPVHGPYLRECQYPQLFSISKLQCVAPAQANCRWRLEPKNPCDYAVNQYCEDPTYCPPCEKRFPKCENMVDGKHPVRGSDNRYFICNGGKFISLGACTGAQGAFDPKLKICKAPYDCTGLSDGNHPIPGSDTQYFICKSRKYVNKKSCAPDTFDAKDRICIQSPCAALPDGNYVIPGQKEDYFVCQNGKFIMQTSCSPFSFDSNAGECFTHPDCAGKSGNYPLPNSPMEYYKCMNDRYIETTSCEPQTYNAALGMCDLPNCIGLPDGNNQLKGSAHEYILCRNSYYIRTGSCAPTVFDPSSRQCKMLDCTNLPDGSYPVPGTDLDFIGSDTEWIRCVNGERQTGHNCSPLPFDPISGKCQDAPSCAGLSNGNHGFKGLDSVFYSCENGILLFIKSCAPLMFDETTRECKWPTCFDDGNYAISWNNRAYVTCRGGQIIFEGDCRNSLFNPVTEACIPEPDCKTMLDGRHLLDGTKDVFFECSYGSFLQFESCTPNIFDEASERCIPPVNPSDPALFCQRDQTAVLPHPESCARYIDCTNQNGILGAFQEECPYPFLFDKTDGVCKPYREVKCGDRREPKSPCDYEKVKLCQSPDGVCPPCEEEHPSCFGKRDGPHAIKNRPEWFVHCADERTYDVKQCPQTAPFFDPVIGSCSVILDPLNPSPYCKANPTVVAPHPDNCAQYIDCRQIHTNFGNYRQECPYPEMFDDVTKICQPPSKVKCVTRPEPKAPCEYEMVIQQCTGPSCQPCGERYPSCVGLPAGNNPYPKRKDKYIICENDRTIGREQCTVGFFDPIDRICTIKFDPTDPEPYCRARPTETIENNMVCSQYYDCSKPTSQYGRYLHECPYPLLFSRRTKKCEEFTTVDCDTRFEPMIPCEYIQNKCQPGSGLCKPCVERLPSCIGLTDGNNTYPGRENTPSFITCFRNRTIFIKTCEMGFFNPITRECQFSIDTTNPTPYCAFNKAAVLPHPTSCNKYYDCSKPDSPYGTYLHECKYPMLYSEVTNRCDVFGSVDCGDRQVFQDPCDYDQNTCAVMKDPGCIPCRARLPSCVGLMNGNQSFPGKELSSFYVVCYNNRTVAVRSCPRGFFDPNSKTCIRSLTAAAIKLFCTANKGVIRANPINCAQYFDCGEQSIRARTYLRECPYPMQFNMESSTCQNFTQVTCGSRRDVKLPCQYLQNRCNPADPSCVPCQRRFPSCRGVPDGEHAIPNRPMSPEYMVCYQERTLVVKQCDTGLFDPDTKTCVKDVTDAMIRAFCLVNSGAILPHPFQCAQYYDCRQAIGGSYLRECKYPQLFQESSGTCRNFSEVQCGDKFTPQAPCDYLQNQCPPSYPGCQPCADRLPSCVSLPDGNNPFPGRAVSEFYIRCFQNRTVSVEACQVSNYDVNLRECSMAMRDDLLTKHCAEKPDALIPDPTNCARYFNCSDTSIKEGLNKVHLSECKYPKLFASSAVGCQIFTTVNCQGRYEPRAPCEYVQNQCFGPNCDNCENKYPSCISKEDGSNVFPGKELTRLYTVCYSNRTVAIVSCAVGVYSHNDRACVQQSEIAGAAPVLPGGKK